MFCCGLGAANIQRLTNTHACGQSPHTGGHLGCRSKQTDTHARTRMCIRTRVHTHACMHAQPASQSITYRQGLVQSRLQRLADAVPVVGFVHGTKAMCGGVDPSLAEIVVARALLACAAVVQWRADIALKHMMSSTQIRRAGSCCLRMGATGKHMCRVLHPCMHTYRWVVCAGEAASVCVRPCAFCTWRV